LTKPEAGGDTVASFIARLADLALGGLLQLPLATTGYMVDRALPG